MKNLQKRTKGEGTKPPAERWQCHPSGAASTQWLDGSDSARVALLPAVAASRKREEGDEGATVALFCANHLTLHVGSKNPLGLCYAGDMANLQTPAPELLSATPWRLVKALADPKAESHPLRQGAGPKPEEGSGQVGRVWKWIPYIPGPGEFCVPSDQEEVDSILGACETIREGGKCNIPVFGAVTTAAEVEKEKEIRALKLKEAGGKRFAEQDFNGALTAYAGSLQIEALADADSAKVHANMAACLLKLGGEERAAKALRAAVEAYELDPTYGKAYGRAAQALLVLGEKDAAAEAQSKADELIAVEDAAKKAKNDALKVKWAAKKAREEKLAAEKAKEEYNTTVIQSAPVQPYGTASSECGDSSCLGCGPSYKDGPSVD